MENYIQSNLQPNEIVIWMGRPEEVRLLEKPFHIPILAKWIVSALLVVFCVAYFGFATHYGFDMMLTRNLIIGVLVIAAILVITPLFSLRKLKNCYYCITNQRAMILYDMKPVIVRSRDLSRVRSFSYDLLSTGCGTLYIGERTKKSQWASREQSTSHDLPEEDMPLMFHSVRNPIGLCDALRNPRYDYEGHEYGLSA